MTDGYFFKLGVVVYIVMISLFSIASVGISIPLQNPDLDDKTSLDDDKGLTFKDLFKYGNIFDKIQGLFAFSINDNWFASLMLWGLRALILIDFIPWVRDLFKI